LQFERPLELYLDPLHAVDVRARAEPADHVAAVVANRDGPSQEPAVLAAAPVEQAEIRLERLTGGDARLVGHERGRVLAVHERRPRHRLAVGLEPGERVPSAVGIVDAAVRSSRPYELR